MKKLVAGTVICGVLAACMPPPAPPPPPPPPPPPAPLVRPFGDSANWVVVQDMNYRVGETQHVITVPSGFVTDFASIPPSLAVIGLSPHGQYSRAAVIHDFLYWAQPCSREQADRLLLIAMMESAVGSFDKTAVYQGVNLFGRTSWESNRRQREAGRFKILPEEYLQPEDPNMSWQTYQDMLLARGIKDPEFAKNPPYCALGDQDVVPK